MPPAARAGREGWRVGFGPRPYVRGYNIPPPAEAEEQGKNAKDKIMEGLRREECTLSRLGRTSALQGEGFYYFFEWNISYLNRPLTAFRGDGGKRLLISYGRSLCYYRVKVCG